MKLTRDDYEAFLSKQVENISRSGEGQLVASNKTAEGPSASGFQKEHKQDIYSYASFNGYCRYWFRVEQNWLSNFANDCVSYMLSKDYLIPADGKTEKYLFDAINCYDEVYATDNFF